MHAARELVDVAMSAGGGCIASRMPYADYAAMPGENISALKELRRSPLHYRHRRANPKTSDALTLGTAAHCAVLEPERFAHDFAVWDQRTASGRLRPRNGKDWDAFRAAAESAGQTILTEDEAGAALAMQAAVRGDPTALRYLEAGDPEVSMTWARGAHRCKGRADWLTFVGGMDVVVGLKTARDCRPFQFSSQAAKLGYHIQWAYYFDGYEAITGRAPHMVEVVVESAPPHAVAVYVIPEDIILQGREEYEALLALLTECRAADAWPGPVAGEQILTLPSWVYGPTDDDLTDLGLEA